MVNVHKLGWCLIVASLILQVGCREAYIERQEDRIVGEWYFSTVRFIDFLEIDNISDEYEDARITFYSDYSVSYITNEGDELAGTWTYNIVDGGEESINQVVMQLENVQTGEDFLFLWDDFRVTNRRIRAQQDYEGGQINYVLRRW